MNGRIDELMIQAGARFEMMNWVHYDDFEYKIFAELIIRECSKLVATKADHWGNINDKIVNAYIIECSENLLEHFGVE